MRKSFLVFPVFILFAMVGHSMAGAAAQSVCATSDKACQEFARLIESEQYDKLVERIDPRVSYSPAAKENIGQAYLMIAGRDGNTPEQEEMYCKKALEFGATSAYMGLYFINADRDAEAALGYLRKYVETKPNDSVPYVILGEDELAKKNYAKASEYLLEAKKVSHGRSGELDWLLFQATYLSGDYATSSTMLDSSFSEGKTIGDLKALITRDPRYSELGRKNEFRKFFPLVNSESSSRRYTRS